MGLLFSFFSLVVAMGFMDSFLCGMWGMGLVSLFTGLMVFSNLGVEGLLSGVWVNGLSVWLVIVSVWVGGVCYLCSNYYGVKDRYVFGVCVFLLIVSCVLLFMVVGWFLFYFFFEVSLVPIIFLILGWGYQPERLQAAAYMIMYTVCVSLPMLLVLYMLCNSVGSSSFYLKVDWFGWYNTSVVVIMGLSGAFLVKSPVFLVHLWLPKAHVEAPVSGSMILAGILLKFGGYGFIIEFYWFLFNGGGFCWVLVSFILWGGFVCGFICLRQVDIKSLVAYSSVGHMALCLAGVVSCCGVGWWGGLLMMISHGLCSPGLFGLAGYVYSLFGSRAMFLCSGVLSFMPIMSLCWFLMCSGNMAFPPSLSLLSEIMLMSAVSQFSLWLMVPMGFMTFVVGVYSLVLYSYIQHGSESGVSISGKLLGPSFILMSFLFWVPLNMLVLCGDLMSGWL